MEILHLTSAAEDAKPVTAVVFDNGNVATDGGRHFFSRASFAAWLDAERMLVDATAEEVQEVIGG